MWKKESRKGEKPVPIFDQAKKKYEVFKGREEGPEKAIFQCYKTEYVSQLKTMLKELTLFVEQEYKGSQDNNLMHLSRAQGCWADGATKPLPHSDEFHKAVGTYDYKEYHEKRPKLKELKSMAYALVLGQCSPRVMLENQL